MTRLDPTLVVAADIEAVAAVGKPEEPEQAVLVHWSDRSAREALPANQLNHVRVAPAQE